MTTETKSNYTIDEVALWNAGINPDRCEGCVEFAAKDRLLGWELAVKYRDQIEAQILNGELIPSIDNTLLEKIVDDDQPPVSIYTTGEKFHEQFYLSFEDARKWRPAENPFKSKQPKTNRADLKKPTQSSTLLMIALLTTDFYSDDKHEGQTMAMRHIQLMAEKLGISDKNLSEATIKRNLKAARDKLKKLTDKRQMT